MSNCKCCRCGSSSSLHQSGLPLICLVPRDEDKIHPKHYKHDDHHDSSKQYDHHSDHQHHKKKKGFKLLSDDYIKKNFKLPPRPLYLDPFRRPLITFPMSNEGVSTNFTTDRKAKINQAILDGILDSSAAICEPSVFPYADKTYAQKKKIQKEDTELIYILQLPDLEHRCPIHNEIVRTPRFIWHSEKKTEKNKEKSKGLTQGGGPMNKPKPWLLSRHTDFDYYSQW